MTCGQQLMKTLSSGENAFVGGELDRLDRRRSELEANLRAATERIEIADQTPQATENLARELKCLDNIWDNLSLLKIGSTAPGLDFSSVLAIVWQKPRREGMMSFLRKNSSDRYFSCDDGFPARWFKPWKPHSPYSLFKL